MHKTFDTFDISKFIEEIKKIKLIDIDPYGEDDWDEIENNETIFYITKNFRINFEKYDNTQDIKYKFKKLNRENILRSLIRMRNRQITRNKIGVEKLFREINDKVNYLNIEIDTIIKNGNVINSNKNITINDIKNKKYNDFTIYYISQNNKGIIIDQYNAQLNINENNDIFLNNWWDEVEKYRGEIGISFQQKTFNNTKINEESLNTNLYFTQLKYLVDNNIIILESKNSIDVIKNVLKNKMDNQIKNIKKQIIDVRDKLKHGEKILNVILYRIETRFPNIKK